MIWKWKKGKYDTTRHIYIQPHSAVSERDVETVFCVKEAAPAFLS